MTPRPLSSSATRRPQRATASEQPEFRPRRLLVTTDFSGESKQALPWAVTLAQSFQAELDLLHVQEPPPRWAGTESLLLLAPEKSTREQLESGLRNLAGALIPDSIPVTPLVRSGKPVAQILRTARDRKSDLMVLATHGYSGWKHALLGSVTERVIRQATCPVLAVRTRRLRRGTGTEPESAAPLRRILVATDFSENSQAAFPLAWSLAKTYDAQITLVSVVQRYPIDALLGTEVTRNTAGVLQAQAREELESLRDRLTAPHRQPLNLEVAFGHPAQEIARVAHDHATDLIVIATRGHTGLRHAYLGSVAERVVQHAPCTVLVVPNRAR